MSEAEKKSLDRVAAELAKTDPADLPVIGAIIAAYNAGKAEKPPTP